MNRQFRFGDMIRELAKSKRKAKDANETGKFPFFVCSGSIRRSDFDDYSDEAIILSTGGSAYVHYCNTNFSASGDTWVLATDQGRLDTKYAYYYLESKKQEIDEDGFQGSGLKHLRKDYIRDMDITLPPLHEQQKIAEILSGIDKCISANLLGIKSLTILYTSLLADSLKKLPGDCALMPLADACSEVFLGLTSKVDYVENQGVPLVRASNISNGSIDFDSARSISREQHASLTKYRKAQKGDVLVTKSGSLGECAIVHTEKPFSIYESIVCLKPKQGILSTEYLFHAMRCSEVRNQFASGKVGSAVAHLNLNDFRRIAIPVPSLGIQKVISSTLDSVQANIKKLQADTEKKELLKIALSSDLMSGCQRVTI